MDLINNEAINPFEMVINISESLFKYDLKIKGLSKYDLGYSGYNSQCYNGNIQY